MIRRLIGFILSVIVSAILFLLLLQIFPSKIKTVDVVNMSYIFVDTDGTEYDVFEPVHGAARDWSFLFNNNNEEITDASSGNDEIENITGNTVLGNIDYVGELEEEIDAGDNAGDNTGDNTGGNIETIDEREAKELSNIEQDDPYNLPEGAIEKPIYKDCETPWGITIKHNESILAYQQRKDVPDICNVQRRSCNNGVLDGNFTQPACNETVIYANGSNSRTINSESTNIVSYTKKQVVSHNDTTVKDELIQTPKYAKNELAEYDKNGKIKKGSEQPITSWDNNDKEGMIGDYDSKEQINIKHYNCKSPWGEIVQHGQFIRAYELPYGFTNASCRVELRLCVDGELKGSYTYNDCQYLDITYEEYNNNTYVDDFTNTENIHNVAKEKVGFWGRIRNLFK